MKKKRSKCSIFYDSTKNKIRKQEQTMQFYQLNENNRIKSPHPSNSSQNIVPKNNKSAFATHSDNTHHNQFSRHIISPLISIDGSLESDTFYQANSNTGSGFTYKRKDEKRTYLYGFTDSRFIYFLGKLEPRAYLIFVTLIALLILEDLNETEGKIIFAFISNVADSMQTVIEQEVILNSYNLKNFQREQGAALQKDFDLLFAELNQLKKEISSLNR